MGIYHKLQILKSGASSDGLGGVITADRITGQTGTITMPGVTLAFSYGNSIGDGELSFFKNGDTIDDGTDGANNPSDIDSVPGMTSETTPGGICSSSGANAFRAFNNNPADNWGDYSPGWIAYEFDSPKKINKYTLQARSNPAVAPNAWTIDGWNGSSWDNLHTVTDEPAWGALEKRGYTFTNNTAYIKYRVYSTSTVKPNIEITEIEFIENQAPITAASDCLTWQPPGEGYGAQVDVSSNGEYVIEGYDGTAAIVVNVVSASLPGTAQNETVAISYIQEELFDDIESAEALNGDTEYRCIYFKNTDTASRTVKIWLEALDTGGATIAYGLDPGGVNAVAQIIQNENVAPYGVSFSTPADINTALSFTLAQNQYHPVWVKRNIAGGEKPQYNDVMTMAVNFA